MPARYSGNPSFSKPSTEEENRTNAGATADIVLDSVLILELLTCPLSSFFLKKKGKQEEDDTRI